MSALGVTGCGKTDASKEDVSPQVAARLSPDNFVSRNQIDKYASSIFQTTKAGESIDYTIEPLCGTVGDTLAYVVNTEGYGWRIISADARTPAILAEDYQGSFSLHDGNPGIQIWLDFMKRDMAAVRQSTDDKLKFGEDEIAANKAFWSNGGFRAQDDPQLPFPNGTWGVRTTIETLVADSLNHMTPHWDQGFPYNVYCPLKSWSTTIHVPAGCTAIAGAEVLYYLHYKIGVPEEAYGTMSWNGDVPEYGSPSTANWDLMDPEYNASGPADKEAILIERVGYQSGMSYADTASAADLTDLREGALYQHNIVCSQRNYNQDTVKRYLSRLFPVIVSAYTQLIGGVGHSFVIDGYKKTYTKYTYYHYYIPNDPDEPIPPGCESYYTYHYTTPEITAIKINWGWRTQWALGYQLNDGWFTLTGDWTTEQPSEDPISFNYWREMLYGFTENDQ